MNITIFGEGYVGLVTSTSLLPMTTKNVGVEFDQLIDLILNMVILNND